MTDFITLSCPSCGEKLKINECSDRVTCAACGNEHVVNRSGDIATLKPVLGNKDALHKAILYQSIIDWNNILEQQDLNPELRKQVLDIIKETKAALDKLEEAAGNKPKAE
jgi:ribosomal protein S27E